MKKIIILVIVAALSVVFTVEWAAARGYSRRAIDRQWKKVQIWQANQDRMFKVMEREAERSLREMYRSDDSWTIVPYNGYQRQCP
jgi:hypothetical protein